MDTPLGVTTDLSSRAVAETKGLWACLVRWRSCDRWPGRPAQEAKTAGSRREPKPLAASFASQRRRMSRRLGGRCGWERIIGAAVMNSACTSGRVGWLAVATAEDAALPERWPSRGRHGRHLGGQAQMAQVAGDVFGVLDERDELHLSPATIVRRLAIYLAPSRAKRRATPSAKTCSCTIRLSTRVAPMAKSKK